MRIYVGFFVVAASYLAVALVILFACLPVEKNWQIYPNPGSKCLRTI